MLSMYAWLCVTYEHIYTCGVVLQDSGPGRYHSSVASDSISLYVNAGKISLIYWMWSIPTHSPIRNKYPHPMHWYNFEINRFQE